MGKTGAFLGLAAAVVLTAGGVGAAVAGQPVSTPAAPARPATDVIPVLDEAPTTTTTTTSPTASAPVTGVVSGGQGVTITVVIKR